MSLAFHPKLGAIVMAAFPDDYLHGEMEKCRPVIVISRKRSNGQKCATVVPISMTEPHQLEAHHVRIAAAEIPRGLRDQEGQRFAKCDCVNTISLARMDLVAGPRVRGRRTYEAGQASHALLLQVRRAVAGVLGIHEKTFLMSGPLPPRSSRSLIEPFDIASVDP